MRSNASRPLRPLATVAACICAAVLTAAVAAGAELQPNGVRRAALATPAYTPPAPADLSALSWTAAFDALLEKMSREYAFTAWRDIHWQALAASYGPRIAVAQAAADLDAYYLALREFVHEFRDGHVSIKAYGQTAQAEMDSVERNLAGGGFGLIATQLDDGSVTASWVKPGGPAAQAGIEAGASILAWNGNPVNIALEDTSTLLGPAQPTDRRMRYEQLRYLVRSPVASVVDVSFRNRGESAARTVFLTAVEDSLETLVMTDARSILKNGWPKRTVEHRMLPGRVGYLRINLELDLPANQPGDHTPTLELFRSAIAGFVNANVTGLIVDIRSNAGGSDKMVTDLMASFYQGAAFYEYQNFIVPATGEFEIWVGDDSGNFSSSGQGLWIEPGAPRYTGPVVALVDNGCISSCEGLAMSIKNLPNGRLVGVEGTNGSFGMVGGKVLMPGNFEIDWPYGQSLNEQRMVQTDSRHGAGGVLPNYRVPMTLPNALRIAAGEDVVLQFGLRALRARSRPTRSDPPCELSPGLRKVECRYFFRK